jgi:hypothetical protein
MIERDCLAYDPFAYDETDVRPLRDRFVTTRTPHQCNICWDDIPAGVHIRAKSEINREEHKTQTFYFCVPCCEAMAISWQDNGEAIEARTSIGIARANNR